MTGGTTTIFAQPSTRRRLLASATAITLASQQIAHANASVAAITINARIMHQTFEGWGTSLAWWGHVVGGFSPDIRRDYLTKIFGTESGLGLTVARYNIGGGENPQDTFLSYRAAIPGYAPRAGRFDWRADGRQRLILHECMSMGVTHIQAFSNSPPYYMTVSGSVTGAKNGGDNLKVSDFQAFAEYLADVVKHFDQTWGIRFQTLEAFNEPTSNWWKYGGQQEGCRIGNAEQNRIIPMLAKALRRRGSATRIAAPDDNSIDETLASVKSYDAQTLDDLYQIDTHSYSGTQRQKLRQFAAANNKRLWMSEYGDGDKTGLTMASRIIQDMRELRPLAWVYWQAVDGGGGWGFFSNIENGKQTRYIVNKKYYVMANFSRFIRPGFQYISVTDTDCISALHITQGRLIIVAVNAKPKPRPVLFNLTGFRYIGGRVHAYVTSPTDNLKLIAGPDVTDNHFRVTLPGKSTTTFVIDDCRL